MPAKAGIQGAKPKDSVMPAKAGIQGARRLRALDSRLRGNDKHSFSVRLLAWFDHHGRHHLPWQHPRDAYRVWLSEIMLQQTQVATVIPYFQRFLQRFPDIHALAQAPLDDVLQLWAGLGYYARARNLHRCARAVVEQHGGEFPRDVEAMQALPGIGRSTAAAVLAQAFGERHAILDGNVRRVLARHGAVEGWPGEPRVARQLWALSESHLPRERLADYTQAIMDLGATTCTARKPICGACPVRADCAALAQGSVASLPSPRPRRERPQRSARMLLLENARCEVLIERRPAAGLWGGLWCLPMADADADWRAHCRDRYALDVGDAAELPVVRHAFTHFDLDLAPLRVRVVERAAIAEGGALRWTTIGAAPDVGVPAPVRTLIASL